MKVLIMSADGFEDSELLCPYYRLREAGIQVDIATPNRGTIQGKHGYVVTSDLILESVKPEDYVAVVIPGGKAPGAGAAECRGPDDCQALHAEA